MQNERNTGAPINHWGLSKRFKYQVHPKKGPKKPPAKKA